jgi:hypothetical protein
VPVPPAPPTPAPVVAAPPVASPPVAAAPAERPRHRHHQAHENLQLRGMVWSEKEQRLVPADTASPGAALPGVPPSSGDAPLPLSSP